jgi:hypothetical protein
MEHQSKSDVHRLLSFQIRKMSSEEPPNVMTKDGDDDNNDSL